MTQKDFFVSYNSRDRVWAEWIAWTLEEAGYSVIIQAWDFRPGGNFVLDMQKATQVCDRTIAVLSDNYLQAEYTQPEWAAAFAKDPQSLKRLMIPIRIQACTPEGLLGQIVYVDLVGCSQAEAQAKLQSMLQERAKPSAPPAFPGAATVPHSAAASPIFPGEEPPSDTPPEPTQVLGVYGWDGGRVEPPPTVELDWQPHCDRDSRKVPSLDTWETVLFPELKAAKQTLADAASDRCLQLVGNRPLTMTLAIGFTFPAVAGYQLCLQQMTGGRSALWSTAAAPSAAQFQVCREQGMEGLNLMVAIGISTTIWEDVSQFQKQHRDEFNAVVYLEPEVGTGFQALKSDADAVALAIHAKELMRQYRRQYEAKLIHLILAAPATFALCLGQQLNALGQIVAYERTEDGSYQPSVRLRTG
jgi:hypothetical protein